MSHDVYKLMNILFSFLILNDNYILLLICRKPSSQLNKIKPSDFNSGPKNKIFWSTVEPEIDLSKEFSKENKLEDVVREKHSTNAPTNFTIIIEDTRNFTNIVKKARKQTVPEVATNLPPKESNDKR